jgi:hypothetical protein
MKTKFKKVIRCKFYPSVVVLGGDFVVSSTNKKYFYPLVVPTSRENSDAIGSINVALLLFAFVLLKIQSLFNWLFPAMKMFFAPPNPMNR